VFKSLQTRVRVAAKKLHPPDLPVNPDGSMLIYLGCGEINMPGYINVDMLPLPHVHYVSSVSKLPMFSDRSADLLYACHVLEHVPRRDVIKTLMEWRRVVKEGGIVRISVPDFDALLAMRESEDGDVNAILDPLMGSQDHQFDFHFSVYTEDSLSRLLKEAGFDQVRQWDADSVGYAKYGDWSSRCVTRNSHRYFISLNLEAQR
jgi:predicted SAM-dependent methyltransferase